MKATKIAKSHRGKRQVQASTSEVDVNNLEMPAKPKRGLKRPRPELGDIIRLINLLPADPPPLPLTTEQANSLTHELNAHLSAEYDAAIAEDDRDHAWERMEFEYLQIREAREALCKLIREANEVSDEETLYFHEPIDAVAYLSITTEGTVRVSMSAFARAIEGAEVDYLRYCEMCGKLFYAGRKKQPCCTPKCAKALRQKRWRQKYKDGEPRYYK